ncbi:hypothetical protein ABZW03_28190 [Kitasatospora sp. NPDC004799]|uniref:hypothetical protein n=1 Tax=Kitasatospora sp. NPDC004799 TaxID=3154460 RepID=UPI0033B189D3
MRDEQLRTSDETIARRLFTRLIRVPTGSPAATCRTALHVERPCASNGARRNTVFVGLSSGPGGALTLGPQGWQSELRRIIGYPDLHRRRTGLPPHPPPAGPRRSRRPTGPPAGEADRQPAQ